MKIAFFVQWMLCGGVENSLIELVKKIEESGNDITIYMILEKGEFVKKIPTQIHKSKIPMPEKVRKSIPIGGTKIVIRESLDKHQYQKVVYWGIKHIVNKEKFAELNVNFDKIPKLQQHYDIAVNYHIHSPFLVRYLSEKVNADKKLTWIHNDFKTTQYNIKILKRYLDDINIFYGVSQKLVDEFTNIFPEYVNKTKVALNIVPIEEIKKKADLEYPKEFLKLSQNITKILTVGRLEEQKGYDIALNVCKKLVEENLKIEWFALGEGTLKEKLISESKKLGIEKYFHFVGVRMNPYSYFKNCDIYVQTSRHEGYCTTITEAKVFYRPIVTTDVAGAREQIIDGISGDVADIEIDSVVEKLRRLIKEKERQKHYMEYLKKENKVDCSEWLKVFK
jgi:Glycosyltransferase